MNGVLGNTTTFESDLPGLKWAVGLGEGLGVWFLVGMSALITFGLFFSAIKGKYGFVLLAFLIPGIGTILTVVGGIRLAKPRSYWARNLYDRKAMAAAIERHEPPINLEDYPESRLREGYQRPVNRPSTDHLT